MFKVQIIFKVTVAIPDISPYETFANFLLSNGGICTPSKILTVSVTMGIRTLQSKSAINRNKIEKEGFFSLENVFYFSFKAFIINNDNIIFWY